MLVCACGLRVRSSESKGRKEPNVARFNVDLGRRAWALRPKLQESSADLGLRGLGLLSSKLQDSIAGLGFGLGDSELNVARKLMDFSADLCLWL